VFLLTHYLDKFSTGCLILIRDANVESALGQPFYHGPADAARAPCYYSNLVWHCLTLISD
jgi:hypothetical protein